MQEALTRAWRHRAVVTTSGEPVAWLLTITRNEARRMYARRRDVLVDELPPCEDVAAGDAVTTTPERLDVRRAVGALPDRERALVALRYDVGLTHGQLAETLGIPEGTVKVHLHRLRKRLRAELEEY